MLRISHLEYTCSRALSVLFVGCALLVNAHAQIPQGPGPGDLARNPNNIPNIASYNTAPGTGVLVFRVFAEEAGARMEGPVRLELMNLANHLGVFQTVEGDKEGVFVDTAFGSYEIEVSALGYISARREVQVVNTMHPEPIDIVLQRDPSAINLDVTPGIMSAKARKEVQARGLSTEGRRPRGSAEAFGRRLQISPFQFRLKFSSRLSVLPAERLCASTNLSDCRRIPRPSQRASPDSAGQNRLARRKLSRRSIRLGASRSSRRWQLAAS